MDGAKCRGILKGNRLEAVKYFRLRHGLNFQQCNYSKIQPDL